MFVLGIETSCDETAAAVTDGMRTVRSNVIASSRDAFAATGGVIPEVAARRQLECIQPVVRRALQEAALDWSDIDMIAVTRGPGLIGSLIVGTTAARIMAAVHDKPLIGVHHTLGHLSSTWLDCPEEPTFPILTLSASGGHTELWLRTSHLTGTLLGSTRDDAAGEAFDKGAALLELPYPGGPAIAALAKEGNRNAVHFPLPLHNDDTLDFSFSGLKTALRYVLRDAPEGAARQEGFRRDLAASYEDALCNHLLDRLERALRRHPEVREIHAVGGVSANARLRELLATRSQGRALRTPRTLRACTDNAAMIAAAGVAMLLEDPAGAGAPFVTAATLPLSSALRTMVEHPAPEVG